ncbi:MAG: hypothetical protein A2X86_12370 [Bdellovibrionales bacterium GWA2_49_15]|nr:MAG: hypothetical protein A2X86_12370 [Bdellovibrionales bacterium GWA2_49_15]
MTNRDYQWPEFHFRLASLAKKSQLPSGVESQIDKIESFFNIKFNARCFVFPSARSALSAIFQFKGLSRRHTIFAPKWSSHCVWDAISRYANPTCTFVPGIDMVLLVHKWGYTYKTKCHGPSKIISDSVDSVFSSSNEVLENSSFEIISLSKTLGAFCGGLVVCHDPNFANFARQLRTIASVDLASAQEHKKLAEVNNDANGSIWHSLEYKNFLLGAMGLENILNNLENFTLAANSISSRIDRLTKKIKLDYLPFSNSRLPCVLPLLENKHKIRNKEMFMQRQFNFSFQNEEDQFSEALLIPVHLGISDDAFNAFLSNIE